MDSNTDLTHRDVPIDAYEHRLPAETPLQRLLFFRLNRWLIVIPILIFVFAVSFALGHAGILVVRNQSMVGFLLSVFIAGNFTLVTIVITINQLVLSREFGKPHSLRERNKGIQAFRRDVLDSIGRETGPAGPRPFLRSLVQSIEERATRLEEAVDGRDELVADVERFASAVGEQAADLDADLDDGEFGEFDLLISMLFYRIAWQHHATQRLQAEHTESLSDEAIEHLQKIEKLLEHFNTARQYVQTLYMQKELAQLSRLLLYVSFPTLLVISFTMLLYTRGSSVTVDPKLLLPLVSLAITMAFFPLAILLAYMLRISTIVSRMPLLSPFVYDG